MCTLVWAGPSLAAQPVIPASVTQGTITVDGRQRDYFVHVPAGAGSGPFPLVLVLHGGGGNGLAIMRSTAMNQEADRRGFIAVYPNGTGAQRYGGLTWNAGNCCGYAFDHKVDDVKFFDHLLAELDKDHSIDPKRIFVTGMSNGGMMSYRLASELSQKIAAIAPVEGAMNNENPSPTSAVSVVIFHGLDDKRVPYNGGTSRKFSKKRQRVDKPVSYAVDFWVKFNGCSGTPQKKDISGHVYEEYTGCTNGTAVALYSITGGGHSWPGGTKRGGGKTSVQNLSATERLWEFFKDHPKQ